MALILNEEVKVNSVQEALEKAGMFFYRLEKLANSSIAINECKEGDFQNPLYKQDCIYYQLETIRDVAKQCENLIDDLAVTFGRSIDLKLKELDKLTQEAGELLPEESGQAVLASGTPSDHPAMGNRGSNQSLGGAL